MKVFQEALIANEELVKQFHGDPEQTILRLLCPNLTKISDVAYTLVTHCP
jgi:hypothetical protein